MITEERIKEILAHVFGVPSISSPPSYAEVHELCGMALQLSTLTAKVKRYEDAMVHIHKMGCAYKGNLTGCPACYICNEFPEFNEMNKRDRSEHGNN